MSGGPLVKASAPDTHMIPWDIIDAEVQRMYGEGALRSEVEAVARHVLGNDQELMLEVYLQAMARQKMDEVSRMQKVNQVVEGELFESDRLKKASTRDLIRMRELGSKIEHRALEYINERKQPVADGVPDGGRPSFHQHVHIHSSEEAKELAALSRADREKLREIAEMLESGARNIGRQILQENEPGESSNGG